MGDLVVAGVSQHQILMFFVRVARRLALRALLIGVGQASEGVLQLEVP
jgi:hypothetical protein